MSEKSQLSLWHFRAGRWFFNRKTPLWEWFNIFPLFVALNSLVKLLIENMCQFCFWSNFLCYLFSLIKKREEKIQKTGVANLGLPTRCLELHWCVFFIMQPFMPKISSAFELAQGHVAALYHNNRNNKIGIESSVMERNSFKKPVLH